VTRSWRRTWAFSPVPLLQSRSSGDSSGELVTDAREFLDVIADTAFRLIPRFALAILVLLAFVGIAFVARLILRRVFARTHLERDVTDILMTLVMYVVVGFGAMLALENLGLNVTSIIAGLGIVGIALGFAAKDTLANFIAGITILWDRPFHVGDRIEVDGSLGVVCKITLRTTCLDTPRNEVVILPNQTMVTEKIINHTMRPSLRIDVPFGIAYRHDVPTARRVALATVAGGENIRAKPEPQVVVTELAASSVNLELRFWLKDPRLEIPMELLYREKVKAALDAAGIEIPFPQLTLHLADPKSGSGGPPAGEDRRPRAGGRGDADPSPSAPGGAGGAPAP
jgi:small conductance mechanosensitive channel